MKIKICGITRFEDALLACRTGAWAIGFIFYDKSPRYIAPRSASEIVTLLRQSGLDATIVGVFVNASLKTITRIAKEAKLNMIQLHGDESLEFCKKVESELNLKVIKAVHPKKDEDIPGEFIQGNVTVLVDAFDKKERGGTGKLSNWLSAQKNSAKMQIVLSGGLNSNNLQEAARVVKPYALDLSSGVEYSPRNQRPRKN